MQLSHLKLALYGGGKMGAALLRGWIDAGLAPKNAVVYDPFISDEVKALGVHANRGDMEVDVMVLAVKPQIMPELLSSGKFDDKAMVLSVAAGCTIGMFEAAFGATRPIIRAMPNTPSLVGEGMTAIIGNGAVDAVRIDIAKALLSTVGKVAILDDEAQMDAVTGLSGSGPAYIFYLMDALTAAGTAQGLPETLARQLAEQTIKGAVALAEQSSEPPTQLRENVTSPGGTTAAGLEVLMNETNGLAPLLERTVAAAADRSRALGKM